MATKAQLEQALTTEQQEHEATRKELALFRKRVVRAGVKGAEENGWCEEIERILRKLGLGDLLPNVFHVEVWENKAWRSAAHGSSVDEALDNHGYYLHHRDKRRLVERDGNRKVVQVLAVWAPYENPELPK